MAIFVELCFTRKSNILFELREKKKKNKTCMFANQTAALFLSDVNDKN